MYKRQVMSQYVAGEEEKEAGSPYEAYEKTQQAEVTVLSSGQFIQLIVDKVI